MKYQILFSLKSNEKIFKTVLFLHVCISILKMMFPEWLSGTEPWSRIPGAVRPSSLCL